MSESAILKAFNDKLNSITPIIKTVARGVSYRPKTGEAYQVADLLLSESENPALGSSMYRERGFFQVELKFPVGEGSKKITDRADLLRKEFKRGTTLTSGGVTVIINRTPSSIPLPNDEDRIVKGVRIYFYTEIFN